MRVALFMDFRFRVQFLDASAKVIEEWPVRAPDIARTIAIMDGCEWPDGAVRMQILDDTGQLVHWRARPDPE
jgi:hypothetical protein